ncbi:hypothetical protein THAOC_24656, partial [Thalassiosira oceanica]
DVNAFLGDNVECCKLGLGCGRHDVFDDLCDGQNSTVVGRILDVTGEEDQRTRLRALGSLR